MTRVAQKCQSSKAKWLTTLFISYSFDLQCSLSRRVSQRFGADGLGVVAIVSQTANGQAIRNHPSNLLFVYWYNYAPSISIHSIKKK